MKTIVYFAALNIFMFACLNKAAAQVCSGSLGDAVVSTNFGSGSGIGPALPASQTTYNYFAADCPNDGNYTITNASNNCFGSTWHNLTEDHTPNDVNGYMMLVNASITPSDFYVDTINGLCANTTYEFSAWIVNVLKPGNCTNSSKPNLVFTIETTGGAILGTYSTGDILENSAAIWKQYGLYFTTPIATSSVVIRIRNNAPGGCGNDLALDDIAFKPCGPKVTAAVITTGQTQVDFCSGNTANTTLAGVVSSGYINPSLQWQFSSDGITWADIAGATTSNYLFNTIAVGIYKYRLTVAEAGNIANINCRVASNVTTITIHALPAATAASNSPVCQGKAVTLTAGGGAAYAWTGPAGFSSAQQNPFFIAALNAAGNYVVTVTDQFNCVNTASTIVAVLPKPVTDVFPKSASICAGDSVLLTATGGTSYSWEPVAGLSNPALAVTFAKPANTTLYKVVVRVTNACADTLPVNITVYKKPVVFAGNDIVLLNGQSAALNPVLDIAGINFYWQPVDFLNDATLLRPVTTPSRDIAYTLYAASGFGCGTASDTVLVKVYNDLFIPNTFTPNGDGKNDAWEIKALAAYPLAKILVYNRYGQLIFASGGSTDYWDGKYKGQKVDAGTYVYVIDLKNGGPLIKGEVLIVR